MVLLESNKGEGVNEMKNEIEYEKIRKELDDLAERLTNIKAENGCVDNAIEQIRQAADWLVDAIAETSL